MWQRRTVSQLLMNILSNADKLSGYLVALFLLTALEYWARPTSSILRPVFVPFVVAMGFKKGFGHVDASLTVANLSVF